jgi:hypothetical protein
MTVNSFWTEPYTTVARKEADIISYQQQQNGEIVETIKSMLSPKGITVLHIAIAGSYANDMNSKDGCSDFDTKVIALHSRRDYLLQKVNKKVFQFQTTITAMNVDTELDGTVIDFTSMMQYVVGNNQMACYDMFEGISIYTTRAAQSLRGIWVCKAYEAASLQQSRCGMLLGNKKKLIGTTSTTTTAATATRDIVTTRKLAGEAVNLSLSILYLQRIKQPPPPCSVFDLLECCMLVSDQHDDEHDDDGDIIIDPTRKTWIQDLVALRIQDKTADYVITQDMQNLLDEALRANVLTTEKFKKEKTRCNDDDHATLSLLEEVEDLFLRVIAS